MRKYLVALPVGMGKTRLVWKSILRGECSRRAWNAKIKHTLILGPNPRVYRAWMRELILYLQQRHLLKESPAYLRLLSPREQERRLSSEGFNLPRFTTYSKLAKNKAFKTIKYLVLDEWHAIGGKILHECDKYLEGQRTRRFYIGGRRIKSGIYFVSATPINPVLEEEEKHVDENPLSDEDFHKKITLGKEKALKVIKSFCGNRETSPDLDETKFLEEVRRLGLRVLKGSIKGVSWRLPQAAGRTILRDEKHLREADLRAIKEILGMEHERRSHEHAYAIGLVRTHYNRHQKIHFLKLTRKGRWKNVFGRPYVTVYVPSEHGRKDAAKWLMHEHSRLPRLIESLKTEGVLKLNKTRLALTKTKKVVIFCTHQGVCLGLTQALKRTLGQEYNNADVSNTIAPSSGNAKQREERLSKKKDDLIEEFNKKGAPYILIATDAFSESIDLHESCKLAVHYELPWSPLRLYQRIGRLTRIKTSRLGFPQINSPVKIAHIIIPGSVEEERVNRLRRRIALLQKEDIWPNHYSIEKLMEGLIGSGPSLHYNEVIKRGI